MSGLLGRAILTIQSGQTDFIGFLVRDEFDGILFSANTAVGCLECGDVYQFLYTLWHQHH